MMSNVKEDMITGNFKLIEQSKCNRTDAGAKFVYTWTWTENCSNPKKNLAINLDQA